MNPSLLRLAADMPDQYAETLSRNGCNDWKPPTYLTCAASVSGVFTLA